MAVVAGNDGLVTFASGYAVKVISWQVDFAAAPLDITAMGEAWDTVIGGRQKWSGSYTCHHDVTTQTDAALGGSSAAAVFQFASSGGTTTGEITGSIVITGISYTQDISQPSGVSFTFEGDGAPAVQEQT